MTQKFIINLLTLYGPLAMGWVASIAMAWYIVRTSREHREDYRQMARDVQHALDNNTRVLTAINVRLEDRK